MTAIRAALTALALTLAAAVPGGALAQAQPAAQEAALESLVIVSGGKRNAFQVEVMRNSEQRAKGLMFRRYLPPDRGMLFDFGASEPVAMWMQNTYIPLDMLFIRKDGTIARIAENTEPLSTRTIPSGSRCSRCSRSMAASPGSSASSRATRSSIRCSSAERGLPEAGRSVGGARSSLYHRRIDERGLRVRAINLVLRASSPWPPSACWPAR